MFDSHRGFEGSVSVGTVERFLVNFEDAAFELFEVLCY